MLAPWKKSYNKSRHHIKKQRRPFLTKVHLVKAMVFQVVMYGCENWTIKKAEHQRINAFELWCWRRLLWVPCTAKRSNQPILKEISPEYSLEGLILKLRLQLWPPDVKNWLTGKDPDAGKDWGQEDRRIRVWLKMRHEFGQALRDGEGLGSLARCSWLQRVRHDWVMVTI